MKYVIEEVNNGFVLVMIMEGKEEQVEVYDDIQSVVDRIEETYEDTFEVPSAPTPPPPAMKKPPKRRRKLFGKKDEDEEVL